jgi:hypothetical protein
MTAPDHVLDKAARGWPLSPWMTRGNRKFPLTEHGHLDATTDRAVLNEWWARWPDAVAAIATGEPSGVIALDIDIRQNGNGFDSLNDLGIAFHPEGPTAHTPQGGCAVLFRWPGYFVKTCSGELAPHLDIRGDGGSVLLPPGPGRVWDHHLGPDTAPAANARVDADRRAQGSACAGDRSANPTTTFIALCRSGTRRCGQIDHLRAGRRTARHAQSRDLQHRAPCRRRRLTRRVGDRVFAMGSEAGPVLRPFRMPRSCRCAAAQYDGRDVGHLTAGNPVVPVSVMGGLQ